MNVPIGYENFEELIAHQFVFVDKTLLIKALLDNVSVKVSVITRPRRFGKTLNLSMLKYFFAPEIRGQTTKGLFDGLKIAAQGDAYMQHQGKYPVIFLTLKNIQDHTFDRAYSKLCLLMANTYREHSYLLDSPHLSSVDKDIFRAILTSKASQDVIEYSLCYLSTYLFRHFKVKPWLLVDEYDSPIIAGFLHGYYDQIITLMRGWLGNALKTNDDLERAVITGILRIAKESLFSGVNNLRVYTILNSTYSEYFGFTEFEVQELLEKAQMTHRAASIREWYNGYQFGDTIIYNPWSLVNSIHDNLLQTFWVNTSSNDLVKQLLANSNDQIKMELESIIHNQSFTAMIDENMVFQDLKKNVSAIWSLLLFSGYLKSLHTESKGPLFQCELMAPNREVWYLYCDIIQGWLSEPLGHEQYLAFLTSLIEGRVDEFTRRLQKYLMETTSLYDVFGRDPEKFYHGFVLGMMVSLSESHEVLSNRESGFGRYDVMLIPKDPEQLGIILEFKVAIATEPDLESSAQEALTQIQQRHYAATLQQRGIYQLLQLGISFRGKEVAVAVNHIKATRAIPADAGIAS